MRGKKNDNELDNFIIINEHDTQLKQVDHIKLMWIASVAHTIILYTYVLSQYYYKYVKPACQFVNNKLACLHAHTVIPLIIVP